jgi:ribosomal protein S18 acetylase RimI-like enzyme
MKTEFRKAIVPAELRSLQAFDRKVFRKSDLFPASYWKICESYWMLIDGVKVGCCAFEKHVDFQQDIRPDGRNPRMEGSLYISTTGILPRFQGRGLGHLMKQWQIVYARHYGFTRIVTNTRKRNAAMIALNQKFDFQKVRSTSRYYSEPTDATVVMELRLA